MSEEKKGMSAGRKILIGIIVILVLLTAGVYGYGVYYFTGHFLPGSFVNGFNCSYMDQQEAEALLSEKTAAYVLAVRTKDNGQESISAEEIGLAYSSDGSVKKLMLDQRRFLWFTAFGQHETYEVPSSLVYDEDKFTQTVQNLKCVQDMVMAEDAYINDNGESFEIVPEVVGSQLDEEKLKADISEAVTTGREAVDLEEDGCYINPSVYSDDERLILDCEQMNALTDVIITYDFGDRRKETVDRTLIKEWFTRDDNQDIALDREKAAVYVKSLAEKYDTVGTERTFTTYNGQKITVSGGDYGWVIDQEGEAEALCQEIEAQNTQVREAVYSQSAASRGVYDIGYTYIEVDLTNSRMVLYIDGKPTVDTGIYAESTTPEGVWSVKELTSPAPLGNISGGGNYWIRFTDTMGIYDNPNLAAEDTASEEIADFTDTYNGVDAGTAEVSEPVEESEIWSGGEGVIAVTSDQGAALFQNAAENMPVVIHW